MTLLCGTGVVLVLLTILPGSHHLEIGRGQLIGKVVSVPQGAPEEAPGDTGRSSNDEIEEEQDGTTGISGQLLGAEDVTLWKNLMDDVMNDTDNLDDLIYDDEVSDRIGDDGVPETVDCFGLPEPISKTLRFFFGRTDSKETVNTRFFLSTRRHRERVELKHDPEFHSAGTDFDPTRRTMFIVHGFMSNGNQEWVKNMTTALLELVDGNVVVIDWSGGGGSWKYWKAVANTRIAGAEATKLLHKMVDMGLERKNVHLIGHSLGAHICSYMGAHVRGIGRITGLDPAQPCFQTDSKDIKLDSNDADFVDVIHTNGRVLEKLGLGMPDPIGHVDFYPNGGAKQPGCSKQQKARLFPLLHHIKNRIEKSICSHGRSYMFFIESIKTADKCSFWGHQWDRNDSDANAAVLARCTATNCTEMGIEANIFPARGSFYVPTKARMPYCINDPRTDGEMVESLSQLYRRVERHQHVSVSR